MILFFVLFTAIVLVLYLLRAGIKHLDARAGYRWARPLRTLCLLGLYGIPLAVVAYIVFFVSSVPLPIRLTGGALSIIILLLILEFSIAQRRARKAHRDKQLLLLQQHVRARKLEKQMKEWEKNYGA